MKYGLLSYPRGVKCLGCGDMLSDAHDKHLCQACLSALAPIPLPRCPICGLRVADSVCPECLSGHFRALDSASGVFPYHVQVVHGLIGALKFQLITYAADYFADPMATAIPSGRWDALVPVPLHPLRHRMRGFNQAEVLTTAIAQRTGIPCLSALSRVRFTPSQTTLDPIDREENMVGAFAAIRSVQGLRCLLIDDVYTTGATAEACAAVLKVAGAQKVSLLCAAQSMPEMDADRAKNR